MSLGGETQSVLQRWPSPYHWAGLAQGCWAEHDGYESYSWNIGGNHGPFGTTQASPPILSTSPKGAVMFVTPVVTTISNWEPSLRTSSQRLSDSISKGIGFY